jgi:hypothetical protein
MKTIKNAIKFCDIFGDGIYLNIKKKAKATTVFGGILAIICGGLLIGAIWSMGNDIVYKRQPQTDFEEVLYRERPTFYLNKTNFPMAFCFQDYNQSTFDIPKYFRFEVMTVQTFNTNSTTITYNHEYENCTYEHFPNLDRDYVEHAGINKYLCLKNQNVSIGGYWDNEFIVYSVFRLRLCNNETDGGTCAQQGEIEDFINSRPIAFNLYFQNSIINPNDYADPIKNFIFVIYKNIRLSSSKVYDMFIGDQVITTDRGFLLEDKIEDSSYYFDSSDYDDSDPLVESLMDINLYVSNRQPVINRKYLKVQTILANVGGLAKALFLLMYCLSFYTSQFKLNKTILNRIIEFDIEKDKKTELKITGPTTRIPSPLVMNDTSKSKRELVNTNNNIKLGVERIQVDKFQNEFKVILDSINHRKSKKKFKLSFFSIIRKPCCKSCVRPRTKLKYNLYDKAQEILISYLDISNIVHKFEEFEKLKLVLFNEEQLAMFHFISKDFCSLNDLIQHKSEITRLKNLTKDQENMVKIIMGYKEKLLLEKDNLTSVDQKLLALMDSDLKNNLK